MGYFRTEQSTMWPSRQLLSDFAHRSCKLLTDIIISDYFNRLWPRFVELKSRVKEVVVATQTDLTQLHNKLTEYQNSLTPGSDFVR